ncbi:cytochrome p450 monooxygenase [Fusarium beomiforme]|uniref:Cytochrome p450 monooxygenase n=1 Tax=Fusarium beomiforme TaxID=44412 RepID=A0A9P5AA84_9HYPO|nr:cytochrome p450 monooxygenase [Fusarium beomiforme]
MLFLPVVFAVLFAFANAWKEVPLWTSKDPCPTTIRAVIPSNTPFGRWVAVHDAMKACSNITELELRMVGGSCTEHPDGWNLPFKTDGSDWYLSAPKVLSLYEYDFHESEWEKIRPGAPHWANDDGTWPVSNSTNSAIRWVTDMFYRSRWNIDQMTYNFKYATGLAEYSKWWGHGKGQRWYDQRYVPIERLSMDNMQHWLEAMDFSKVHTLSIEDAGTHPRGKGLLVDLPPALTGLENLSINGRWLDWRTYLAEWEAAPGPLPKNKWLSSPPPPARDFILALPPSLKNLTWTQSGTVEEEVFDSVLKHHGPLLKHLEWTNEERVHKLRPILSDDQLKSLGKWAPGLTSLAIDLERRNGTWPHNQLKMISESLPNLRSLVVYLNLLDGDRLANSTGSENKKKYLPESILDIEEGLELFQAVKKSKVGEKLETVEFRQVDWADDWPWERDLWGDRFWVRCWDVEMGEGTAVRCKSGCENALDYGMI